jgi:uracil-DNA glycosylase
LAQVLVKREQVSFDGEQVSELSNNVKSCHLCKELVESRTQPVTGYGDFTARVLFIGEAPGRLGADMTGIPFTKDRSGMLLQKMLYMIGMNESGPESIPPKLKDVYITNIVKCNPRKEDGSNRSPTKDEISSCMNYLEKEIEIVKPQLIVTLGLPASKVILGKEFDGRDFGKIVKKETFYVMPLWHPAFVIRGGGTQRMNEKKYSKFFYKIKDVVTTEVR